MAPNKRAKHRSTNEDGEKYKNLIINDVLCPICRNILIEPVTLPCNHGFCLACFNGTMENTTLTCPLCRIRIGSWLRSARKEKKIINEVLWRIMQLKFSNEIRRKLEGDDNTPQEDIPIILASPGEIRHEYELQMQKERSEIQRERDTEAKASEMVIKKILEEEENAARLEAEKLRLDEEIARKIASEEEKTRKNATQLQTTPKSSKKSSIDKYLIALSKRKDQDTNKCKNEPVPSSSKIDNADLGVSEPGTSSQTSVRVLDQKVKAKQQCTKAYQHLLLSKSMHCERAESIGSDSEDSIKQEMRYFKPIRAAPAPDNKGKTNLALPLLRITPTVARSPTSVVIRSPQRSMFVRIGAHPRSAFVSCSPEIEKTPPKLKKISIINESGKLVKQYYNRNQYTLNYESNSPESNIRSPCLGFQMRNEQKKLKKIRDVISAMSEHVNKFSDPKKLVKKCKSSETSPKKLNGCDVKTDKQSALQEKLDLEFARRLHEELNNPRCRNTRASGQFKKETVKTRSSPRKRKRQVTLDELMTPKKFKI